MQEDHAEVLEAVLALPQKYKEVVYLYFYEQYTAVEIGKILGKNVNTVYTLLARAKGMLREKLGVKNLRNRIEEAFNAVHAEPELVEKTRLKLRNELYGRQKRMLRIRKYAVSFAVCLLVAVAAAGFWAYQTSVAAIFVDGNTPVELEVNCFNRIIRAEGADGDYSNLCHMQYEDAVESLISEQGESVSVSVLSNDAEKGNRMQQEILSCPVGETVDFSCEVGDYTEYEAAQEAGLSVGKYRAYLELQALDPDVTPEEISGWSMKQIREQISALQQEASSDDESVETVPELSEHGNGNGSGKQWGKNRSETDSE